ncbi:penicillin-binding protein 1C [Pedobacter sp. SD-b]|uniref:peptidoglycan glycosyltransferase n=1 Tax=Pedobacter segetis TaxID=2793069 RepID=A0ABS1BG96_9SPHI|nr:penicillin-binding protein 1C [Pedobacter segetis]MBK0381890.1 penicillin-binding protein 1C [Pedobacter segetis]
MQFKKISKKKKIISITAFSILFLWFWFSLPKPLFKSPTSYVIEADNGELLSASIAKDGQWRFPLNDTVPKKFIKCITTFEDKRFFYHPGVDPFAFGRAIIQNIRNRKIVSGGSTLTMQVIRLSRNKNRTFYQKLIEILLAFRLELTYSKKEILALYAANAPFGSNVVGLDAAAWRYFGRKASQLSWAEMATLAVLPNSPSLVHPGKNRKTLLNKRNSLLKKLFDEKIIDEETEKLAQLEPIPSEPVSLPTNAPHLLNRFRADFNPKEFKTTKIKTTLKANLQINVSSILRRYHQQFKANGINNAAALVLDVKTGNTLAYVGNVYDPSNPEMESYVDMIGALRSPGSTLKPLLYASMMTDGFILPNTLIPDVPTQIGGYTPKNYDLGYDGAVPASKALSRSLNIPAVKMLQQYRYERFYSQLKKMGINSLTNPPDFYGLSMILGGCEVSMWELAGTYASLARSLNHYPQHPDQYDPADFHEPTYITKKTPSKQTLEKSSVADYGSLYYTFMAMQEVMRPGEEMLWQQFSSSKKIAWKTGTSFGFRDGWAVGLTPDFVVCVWVGNADGEGRPNLTGIQTAAPILFDIFDLLPEKREFTIPYKNLVKTDVCEISGFRAGEYCDKKTAYMPISAAKTRICPYHQLVHLDPTEKYQVTSACESPELMVHKSWFVLPPSMEYYYKVRNRDYRTLPPMSPNCMDESENLRTMELIYPKNNALVYIPLEIDGKRGKVIFNAAHRNPKSKIYWSIDNEYIATTTDFHQIAVSPDSGKHTLTLVDDEGNRLVQIFTVLDKSKKDK